MANEINTNNVVAMIKETASFCRDARQIFNDLCIELGDENLIKENDAIRETFFVDEEGAYDYDFYFKHNNLIKGFRLLIAEEDTDEYERYQQIVKKLSVDKEVPLLFIYGCFKPVNNIDQSSINIVSMMDVCCGFTSVDEEKYNWINFNEADIDSKNEILVETKDWTKETDSVKDSPEWNEYFSKAKIKYKPLFELQNRADVENFANEIKDMTI